MGVENVGGKPESLVVGIVEQESKLGEEVICRGSLEIVHQAAHAN